ncbi:MAG: M50 family metallopeptidase, partial [Bacilli bacterium]|nr:M50 family metallopeptidase [Bacilli bacterium]
CALPILRVVEDSILEQAGLQTGDLVTSITGRLSDGTEYTLNNITDFSQISEVIDKTNPKPDEINAVGMTQCLDFEILRNNEEISYNNVCRTFTTFEVSSSNDELVISKMEPIFGLGQTTRDATFNEVITSAWNTEKQMATLIFDALGTLFTKDGLSNVSGPVGMYESAVSFAKDGFLSFLLFLAMISVNLGIINLLPLPALDGGRLLVMIVEKIARRKLNPKVEAIINAVGFIFLIGFIILITIKDIFF